MNPAPCTARDAAVLRETERTLLDQLDAGTRHLDVLLDAAAAVTGGRPADITGPVRDGILRLSERLELAERELIAVRADLDRLDPYP